MTTLLSRTIVIALLAAALASCSRSGPAELLETAEFEELQTNVPHAKELYREILERHPASPQAAKAKARLAALESTPAAR